MLAFLGSKLSELKAQVLADLKAGWLAAGSLLSLSNVGVIGMISADFGHPYYGFAAATSLHHRRHTR